MFLFFLNLLNFAFADYPRLESTTIRLIDIKVVCRSNCNPTYLELPLVLNVICDKCDPTLVFYWSVSPLYGYFNFYRDTSVTEKGRVLTVNAYTFKRLDKISFLALAWSQDGDIEITFRNKPQAFSIRCVKNCPTINPNLKSTFAVDCDPHCANAKFMWSVYPTTRTPQQWSQLMVLHDNNKSVDFLPGSFDENWQYTILLLANDASHNMTVKAGLGYTKLHILCVKNCGEYVLADELVEVSALCVDCTEDGTIKWSVQPEVTRFEISGDGGRNFRIPANSFGGGIFGSIHAEYTDAGDDVWYFTTKGSCYMSPESGNSVTTDFRFNCTYPGDIDVIVFQKSENIPLEFGVILYEGTLRDLANTSLWLAPGHPTLLIVDINEFSHSFSFKSEVSMYDRGRRRTLESFILSTYLYYVYWDYTSIDNSSGQRLINWNKLVQSANILIVYLREEKSYDRKTVGRHFIFHMLLEIDKYENHIHYEQCFSLMALFTKDIRHTREAHLIAEIIFETLDHIPSNLQSRLASRLSYTLCDSFTRLSDLSTRIESYIVPDYKDEYMHIYKDVYYRRADDIHHLKMATFYLIKGIEKMVKTIVGFSYKDTTIKSSIKNGIWIRVKIVDKSELFTLAEPGSFLSFSKRWRSRYRNWYISFGIIRPNMFWWHNTGKGFKSDILFVSLFHDNYPQRFLAFPIDIFINVKLTEGITIVDNLTDSHFVIYKVYGRRGSSMFIHFKPSINDYYTYISETYPYFKDIKKYGSRSAKGRNTSILLDFDFIYIAVTKYLSDNAGFEIFIKQFKCVQWLEEYRGWTSKFCRMGNFTNDTHAHCQCVHFSMITVQHDGLAFKESALSDTMLLDKDPQTSNIVSFTVTAVIGLWCVCMVLAGKRDRYINKSDVILKPIDTMPGDKHFYLILIETGGFDGSGTSATVVIQLFGTGNRKSRKHIVTGHKMLRTDGEDWFIIYSPEYLGRLTAIRLFHDLSGNEPDWYCRRVTVKHVESHLTFIFEVHSWFSLVKGDGKIDKVINTARDFERTQGRYFPIIYRRQYRKDALFESIIVHPPASTFTAKERTTIGFVMIFVTMLCCLCFLGLADKDGWDNKRSLSIGYTEWMIILQTLAVVFSLTSFLMFLFEKSKPFSESL